VELKMNNINISLFKSVKFLQTINLNVHLHSENPAA